MASSVSLSLRTGRAWTALLPLLTKGTVRARGRLAFDRNVDIAKWRGTRLLTTLTILLSQ